MEILVVAIFIIGYCAIAFEHPIRINKTASALFTGCIIWTVIALVQHIDAGFTKEFTGRLGHISEILFFLMGAMTIVELIDMHGGFRIITDRIKTTNYVKLLWLIGGITFFLSAILDNLTTAIVMTSLLRKLIDDRKSKLFFCGIIIIAANAGGAWSPIGDVTTTMLWIQGQITSVSIIKSVFLESLTCLIVPLAVLSFTLKNQKLTVPKRMNGQKQNGGTLMLLTGVSGLVFVPVFKVITHLPPYIGMLISLSVIWIVSEILHKNKDVHEREKNTAAYALNNIDMPSILFFLGILLAIGGLEHLHLLRNLATTLDQSVGDYRIIAILIGAGSAIVDNVPLVAAAQGMYPIAESGFFATDGAFWTFLAYTAGTGGSMLIIGSAPGVAVMGMERIDFIWYLKNISLWAALGFLSGAGVYLLEKAVL